jgi:C-terminal domain on Strawberry notch homologue/P-loop containing NTP hydrolase pore-1/UBA/TS-N domain
MQLEGTIHAATKHLSWLPSDERAGFFIGDGAGTGKGRQIASVILDSYIRGRVKSVWVSTSTDLYADATRDLRDLGCQIPVHNNLQSLDKANVTPQEGVLFVTYSTLTSSMKGRTRLSQLIDWVGGPSFDGCLVFDEAHKSKNYSSNENQGTKVASAVINLQKALPAARVMYCSATGVSEVGNMAYMSRLGLFGAGSAFPTFDDFLASLKKKGISFLEMLAMELKGDGFYLARGLSFRSAEFLELEIPLTQEQIRIYDAAVHMWVDLRAALTQACINCNTEKGGKDPFRLFWSAQQRFFKLLCVSMKVPAIVEEVKQAIDEGNAVVIGLQSTGEAAADALELQLGDSCGWISVTKSILLQFVHNHFPTTKTASNAPSLSPMDGMVLNNGSYGDTIDISNNGEDEFSTMPTLAGAAAAPAIAAATANAAAPVVETDELSVSLKEQMLQRIRALDLPPNFLDELIDKLGGKNAVAEMTGRKARIVRAPNTNRPVYEARAKPDSNEMDSLNIKEKDAFMSGKKLVAIVSDAASTGISLHADQRIKNQRRRLHLTLELPWSADKAIQQLGRSHRSNQVTAPVYKLVFTDLGGERRFAAAVARRLQSLGALTRGDRRAASGLDLGSLNYDSPLGRKALRKMYDAVVEQSPLLPPGIQLEKVLEGLPEDEVAAFAPAADGPDGRPTARNLVEAVENLHTIMRGYVDMMGIGISAPRNDTVAEDIVAVNNYSSSAVGVGAGGAAQAAANAAALAGGNGGSSSSKDIGDVRRFLNRLLAVPVHRQRLLFNYFTLMLNAEIKAAKQAGSYTEGVSDLPGQKITREGPAEELWKDSLTGLSTYRHTVNVDRGTSFAAAQSRLDHDARHGDRSGFYRSRKIMPGTGKHAVLLAMQKPGAAGLFLLTRPNTGDSFFEMDEEELLSKYLGISPEKAQIEWNELYESSLTQCSHGYLCQIRDCHVGRRLTRVTLLSGSVIRIWDTLERVLMRHEFELNKADRTMRIVRVEGAGETPGLPLIGLRYPGHLLPEVLAVLASESQMKLAAAMAAAVAASTGVIGSTSATAASQDVAAMVLNQRRVEEVLPVVYRLYKKAFSKPKSMLDFFKPVAGVGGYKNGGGSKTDATKEKQVSGNKRPNKLNSAANGDASGGGSGEKKIKKKEPSPSVTGAAESDVIMLVDDEDEVVPAALPAVKKDEEPSTSVAAAVSNAGGEGPLPPSRPCSAGSLSRKNIESLIAMGFTKSQAEGALRMNKGSVERAADYLLSNI